MTISIREFSILIYIGIFLLLPIGRIISRTGHSGWLSLLVLVPGVNYLLLIYVAFSEWPVERKQRSVSTQA